MRKKTLTVLFGLTLVITMIFGLLPACGGGETTPQPSATGGVTPTGSATPTGGPAPTAAGEVFNWRYQSNANAGTATYWTEEEFVANIKTATGGRLNLALNPQGAIVGSMEIFDAVATGAIESGNS